MNIADIVLGAVLIVLLALAWRATRKRWGLGGCGCSSGCAGCRACAGADDEGCACCAERQSAGKQDK